MKLNTQPMEHIDRASGETLDVHSVFHTLQGEGPFTGRSAVFIRLAGCNLQCPACDTDYTSNRQILTVEQLAIEVSAQTPPGAARPLVVITGGEPFRQNLYPLCYELLARGYTVQIETNGTLPPPVDSREWFANMCSTNLQDNNCIFVVCSPKTGRVNSRLAPLIAAYKYVIDANSVHDDDGLPILALGHTAHPYVARPPEGFDGPIYLQPADRKNEAINALNRQAVVILVMNAPDVFTAQLQTHKIFNIE